MEAGVLGVRGHSQVREVKSRLPVGSVPHHKSVRFHAWLTRLESHPSTQEADAKEFWVSGQLGLYSETLSQRTENKNADDQGDIAHRFIVQHPNIVYPRMLPLATL